MNNQLAKIPRANGKRNPIFAIVFWVSLSLLAIAFYPGLNFAPNRERAKQQEEIAEIKEKISELEKYLIQVIKQVNRQSLNPIAKDTTVYGDCPLTAQAYQDRYIDSGNIEDFVCYNKAVEKELR